MSPPAMSPKITLGSPVITPMIVVNTAAANQNTIMGPDDSARPVKRHPRMAESFRVWTMAPGVHAVPRA